MKLGSKKVIGGGWTEYTVPCVPKTTSIKDICELGYVPVVTFKLKSI